jgi:tRNA(Ile2)-agmatinylcytidine synthase
VSALGARVFTLGNGMGIVGASASIGFDPTRDHTYELIAYRRRERWATARAVDGESVRSMDGATFPHTFNNFDYQNERVLITPHGPDPVLLGIRGDSPLAVLRAFSAIRCAEDVDGYVIYVSNQHTDAHLRRPLEFPLRTFSSGWVEGRVTRLEVGTGSHVYFWLDGEKEPIKCAVYEPTGDLQRVARLLRTGDVVRVAGGVRRASPRHPQIVNVERIEVKSLGREVRSSNPTCIRCGATMKSEGRVKGFQCPKCKSRVAVLKSSREVGRVLRKGVYLPSPRSQRHLTKQLIRYGSELAGETQPLIEGWLGTHPVRLLRAPARSPLSDRPRLLPPRRL